MIIYGVALLAICTLAGVIMGDMLGVLLGVKSNVGGVGIAMILLICGMMKTGSAMESAGGWRRFSRPLQTFATRSTFFAGRAAADS